MNWLEILKLGMPGALGLLISAPVIAWLQPESSGGTVIVCILCIALTYVVLKLFEWLGGFLKPHR